MAAGAGLAWLALLATCLHFVIVVAYTPLGRAVSSRGHAERTFTVTYEDGRGVLRDLLAACTAHTWTVSALAVDSGRATADGGDGIVSVGLTINGSGTPSAAGTLGCVPGVVRVDVGQDEEE